MTRERNELRACWSFGSSWQQAFPCCKRRCRRRRVPASHDVHRAQGSTYVPLDSWVYDAFDLAARAWLRGHRLPGAAPVDAEQLPARVCNKTGARLEKVSDAAEARRIFTALTLELADENATGRAAVDAVYGRILGIAGAPAD